MIINAAVVDECYDTINTVSYAQADTVTYGDQFVSKRQQVTMCGTRRFTHNLTQYYCTPPLYVNIINIYRSIELAIVNHS